MLIGRKTIRSALKSRRFQSATLLLCFTVVNICPVMPVAAEKDLTQRYPCEQHACGCRSAEQCWRKCCCMTREQKLAWAKAHNVTPPAEFLLAKDDPEPESQPVVAKKNCCAHKATAKKCCSSQGAAKQCASHSSPSRDSKARQQPGEFVLVSQYLGCQGIAFAWLHLQVTLPEHVSCEVSRDLTLVQTLINIDERLTSVASPPDAPPPRSV